MLPAPIVFPRIHLPDWVGIVVRDLPTCCLEDVDRGSEPVAPGLGAGTGPPLLATAAVPAMLGRRGDGEGWAEDLDTLRRWEREDGWG